MDPKEYAELVERLTDLEIALIEHTATLSPVQRVTGTWRDVITALDNMKYQVTKVQS